MSNNQLATLPESFGNLKVGGRPVSAAPLCVLVHAWCSDDDGVCKEGGKNAVGCNVTLISGGVVAVAGPCPTISWQHCLRALAT